MQLTRWHITSCLELRCICSSELSHHICSYRFIPGTGGKWWSKSAPNLISLIKEKHKTSAFRNLKTAARSQVRQAGMILGLGCFPQPWLPRFHSTQKSPTGTRPRGLLSCGSKQTSWKISPSSPHQKAKPPRLHLGMISNDFRETSPLKHKWSCASLH